MELRRFRGAGDEGDIPTHSLDDIHAPAPPEAAILTDQSRLRSTKRATVVEMYGGALHHDRIRVFCDIRVRQCGGFRAEPSRRPGKGPRSP